MIVHCPGCSQTYFLPPHAVAGFQNPTESQSDLGWWLSCGYCDHQWWQPLEQSLPNFPTIMEMGDSGSSSLTVPVQRANPFIKSSNTNRNHSWVFSFASLLIVLISLGGVGYLYQKPLMLFWYQTIGKPISPSPKPFHLNDVSYTLKTSDSEGDDSQVLTVKGEIVNAGGTSRVTPVIRVSVWTSCQETTSGVTSAQGDCLYFEWMFKPNKTQIGGATWLPFETSYPISAKVRRVEVAISPF